MGGGAKSSSGKCSAASGWSSRVRWRRAHRTARHASAKLATNTSSSATVVLLLYDEDDMGDRAVLCMESVSYMQ